MANILPNAETQFTDGNGIPYALGRVFFYIPNTNTPKDTYQNIAGTVLNTNPVQLDADGRAIIWGSGSYRQVLQDQDSNVIWDKITSDVSTGTLATLAEPNGAGLIGTADGNTVQAELNLKPQVLANVTAARTLNGTPNYPVIFVKGSDGGFFVRNPLDTTSAEDGGAYCGTIIRPADYATNGVYVRSEQDAVDAADFGCNTAGLTDHTLVVQTASNYAASIGAMLWFAPQTYILNPLTNNGTFPSGVTYAIQMKSGMHWAGRGAIFKIKDNSSTDVSPKRFQMLYTDTAISDVSLTQGLVFDGNSANNPISPNRGSNSYNLYAQAFVGGNGFTGIINHVTIDDVTFQNNSGTNNIAMQSVSGAGAASLPQGWTITNTRHIDGGLDTNDFTAVYGLCEDMLLRGNRAWQTTAPTGATGPGARNFFEVHGARATVTDNQVRNYFGGGIVNSNFTSPVSEVLVANNQFFNMLFYGVRLWRQSTQTAISDVTICDNKTELNSVLFGSLSTYKAGVYAGASFDLAISNVTINNNTTLQSATPLNLSAGVYLQCQVTSAKQTGYSITNNKAYGTYHGVDLGVAGSGAGTWGVVEVAGNKSYNLASVGASVTTIGVAINGNATYGFDSLTVKDNIAEDDGTGAPSIAIFVQGIIGNYVLQNNTSNGFPTPYSEGTVNIGIRRGDDMRLQFPVSTGVTYSGWTLTTRKTYKIVMSFAAFAAAALAKDVICLLIPARFRLVSLIADVTTQFTGGAVATCALTCGPASGSATYLVSADVFTAPVTLGLTDAQLGTALNRASAVQGGNIASWTAQTALNVRLTTTGANTNALTAGSVTMYVTLESFP